MSLEFWKGLFEIVSVGLLFFTFVCGAGALYFSNRVNRSQADKLRQFDKELTAAKTELGKQQERAANAEIELEKIRKRQEPRGVPVDLLMGILKGAPPPPPGKVIVEYSEGSPETSAFTNTLWMFVLQPLWNVPKPKGVPVPSSPSVPNLGNSEIALVMPDLDNPPEYGKALWQAFTAMGVRGFGVVRDPKLPPGTALILIGPKL